jgi:polyisoprenyl-phosphate glycosyltransferase
MKKIGVVIPTYNEESNVEKIHERITQCFKSQLSDYNYEILFIDNCSTDNTRTIIETLAEKDSHVKAIFNAKNFDFRRSSFYGLTQSDGDCTFLVFSDMQDPPEMLVRFVKEWESGYKVVIGIKAKSKENPILVCMRKFYYGVIKLTSSSEQIQNFNGFGLYDKSFIEILRQLDDPDPYLKGIVSELSFQRKEIPYVQEKRKAGKGTTNFFKMYDFAMAGFTSCSKIVLRLATLFGFGLSIVSVIVAIATFITKLLHWNEFSTGVAAIGVGVFFLGSVQLFFIGLLGEYVLNINTKVMHRPLVIEEKRINFNYETQNAKQSTPAEIDQEYKAG